MRFLSSAMLSFALTAPLAASGPELPIHRFQLPNGMRVVLSQDNAAPVVAVYIIYNVGARSEEKGRTGFAHLFEHMMFQGSKNAPKGLHFKTIESNGGWLNGSTHPDYTDYYQVLPSNKLAVALWLESDRMRGLNITEENLTNQKEAVKQERRMGIDNQPYATAIVEAWPALAFRNWSNSHSLIGSFEDLEAAGVADVARFFRTYYAPNNAALAIAGDIRIAETRKLVEHYFADIPPQPQPKPPDLAEPEQTEARHASRKDALARVPAVLMGYPGPQRRSPDYYALAMLDVALTGGDSSRFQLNLVKGRQSVIGYEANLGWPFASATDYRDPGLYAMSLMHKPEFQGRQVVEQVEAEFAKIQKDGLEPAELERARTFLRASRIGQLQTTIQRATLLGQFELFDGDANLANRELDRYLAVSAEQIQAAARKYLIPARRTVLEIVPAPAKEKE